MNKDTMEADVDEVVALIEDGHRWRNDRHMIFIWGLAVGVWLPILFGMLFD